MVMVIYLFMKKKIIILFFHILLIHLKSMGTKIMTIIMISNHRMDMVVLLAIQIMKSS